jgi:hypothetical protein
MLAPGTWIPNVGSVRSCVRFSCGTVTSCYRPVAGVTPLEPTARAISTDRMGSWLVTSGGAAYVSALRYTYRRQAEMLV